MTGQAKEIEEYYLSIDEYIDRRNSLIGKALMDISLSEDNLTETALFELIRNAWEDYLDGEPKGGRDASGQRRSLRIIKEFNIALASLMNLRHITTGGKENFSYIVAYRELLQYLENAFFICKKEESDSKNPEHGKESPPRRIMYTVSFDLTKGRARMYTLFLDAYGSRGNMAKLSNAALCAVFLPSDQDADDVFHYLPMMIHEASHNFRFSDTRERNEFVAEYISKCLGRQIIRELFRQIPEAAYNMQFDSDIDCLVRAVASVLKDRINESFIGFIDRGHLDQFTSIFYSAIAKKEREHFELEGAFGSGAHPREVLKASFLEMMELGNIHYYQSNTLIDECEKNTLRILLNSRNEELKTSDVRYALDNIVLEVLCHIMSDIIAYLSKNRMAQGLIERALKEYEELLINATGPKWALLQALSDFSDTNEDIISNWDFFYEVSDRLIRLNTNAENIGYICRLYGEEGIPFDDKKHLIGRRIYDALRHGVEEIIAYDGYSAEKAYFTSKKMHAVLIRLGLFDGEGQETTFLSHYDKIFKGWDRDQVVGIMDENLKSYREIFADLGMCAVFGFSDKGYLNFMNKYSLYQYAQISRDVMVDRIDTVIRVLKDTCDETPEVKDLSKALRGRGIPDIKWREFDKRYGAVYRERIKNSKWVAEMKQLPIIKAISEYYNSDCDMNDGQKSAVGEDFVAWAKTAYSLRKDRHEIDGVQAVSCLIEENNDWKYL